jgi:uncharacterized protein YgiM (DUF1202 family)
MSDRYGSYPPDEPVIGASYPPPQSSSPTPGEPLIGDPRSSDDAWDDEYEEGYEDGYEDPYYEDDYDGEVPARQPMFYVFIGVAALIGGVIIFLLYSLFNNGGGADTSTATAAFKVFIDSPTPNQRIEVGAAQDVNVRAKASEAITKFELFVGDQSASADSLSVTKPPAADGTYSATLRLPAFTQKGNNTIKVRVTGASGNRKDSDPVTVVIIEPVGAKPQQIKGKVLADAITRQGPSDTSPAGDTLRAGTEVTILGKTHDGAWLLIDVGTGVWVKATAISAEDSLSLVPIKDPTPVPQPTAANTSVPTPAVTATATPNTKGPDFVPVNATVSNGQVHITIANQSTNSYTGPLVVSISGLTATAMVQVFNVNMPANGSATVDFDATIDVAKAAVVKVDPDNAVKEINEDNNGATFQLKPAEESPKLTATATLQAGTLTVVISNTGGPLAAPTAKIRVTLGSDKNEKTVALAIIKGATQTVTGVMPPAGSGIATVEIVVNDITLASTTVTLP